MEIIKAALEARTPEYPVHELILGRWSPRSMSGESVSEVELFSLFEAAKWAPSASNSQPWRMLYAFRESESWNLFFGLLDEANKVWVKDAAALVLFLSRLTSAKTGAPVRTHGFDAGSAWMNFALQGASMNLVVHGMAGFDYDRAKRELLIPDHMAVQAMAAVGRPADRERLPEALRKRETPSARRELSGTAAEGRWSEKLS